MKTPVRSQRQLRVGEEIRHVLASILMRGDGVWPSGFDTAVITVTEVRVSPDLHNATAFVMPLGGRQVEAVVRVLNQGSGFFRRELGKVLSLRQVPAIRFLADESFAEASKIEGILHDPAVARDLKADV